MIVAGLGCSSRASPDEMRALLEALVQGHHLARIACLQARAAQLDPLARAFGVPLLAVPRRALAGIVTPTQAARIQAQFGTGSVAEACALLGAGRGARIVAARQVSDLGRATCALAEGRTQ